MADKILMYYQYSCQQLIKYLHIISIPVTADKIYFTSNLLTAYWLWSLKRQKHWKYASEHILPVCICWFTIQLSIFLRCTDMEHTTHRIVNVLVSHKFFKTPYKSVIHNFCWSTVTDSSGTYTNLNSSCQHIN